ncbi:MAG: type I secretion protein TolC, partial [Lysobacterales bacterium]
MSNSKHLLALALGACLAAPASAQESLVEVYQRALMNDPAIREAEATYLATAEVKPQARSTLLPGLSFGVSRAYRFQDTEGGAIDPITGTPIGTRSQFEQYSTGFTLSLTQSVFNWSQYMTLQQADKRVVRAETDFRAAQQELILRVATSYFNVLAAEDNLASAVAQRDSVSRQLEQSQRRFEVGLIAITDVQQSQAGYDDAVALEIEAQRLLSTAHEQLREIVGEIVPELAAPTDDLPLLTPDPANADEWVQVALDSNLALQSSRLAADVASDQIKIEKGNRLPEISLSANYNDDEQSRVQTLFRQLVETTPSTQLPEGRSWNLSLSFPIYTGGLNRSRIQQSVHQHRAAADALERIARQTERLTRDAYLGVISEISRVRALRQAVESNRTALRATEAGFEVGTQTTVDVLASQNNLRRIETTYSRSRYDYMLNVLLLKQAAGQLS